MQSSMTAPLEIEIGIGVGIEALDDWAGFDTDFDTDTD